MANKPEKIKIYSENNDYQRVETLKRNRLKRSKSGKFFVEGVNSINSLIENKWKIDTFLYSNKKLSKWAKDILANSTAKKHIEMPYSLLTKLSDKEDPSELLALAEMKDGDLKRIKIKKDLFVVVIDRAANPGNLGTILRSCDSFGVDAVIMTGHSVDLYDPKTIRASVGTFFSLPVIRLESHKQLIPWIENVKNKAGSFSVIGTTVKTNTLIKDFDFKFPLMLIIGNETHGLSNNYKQLCDDLVKIPIEGSASSLNVACATSIFLYEIRNRLN